MNKLIKKLRLQLLILKLKLQVLLLKKKLTVPNLPDPEAIVVHYDSSGNSFESVNGWHKQKWGFKSSLGFFMGYHYFISKGGKIFQARADNEEGAHTVDALMPGYWNKHSIGICLQSKSDMSDAQKKSLEKLLKRLQAKYSIGLNNIYGHRNIKATKCPGDIIYKWLLNYKKSK